MPHITFDWTFNVGTLCGLAMVMASLINYGSKVVRYLSGISFRVDVMWRQFKVDHPDVVHLATREHGAPL